MPAPSAASAARAQRAMTRYAAAIRACGIPAEVAFDGRRFSIAIIDTEGARLRRLEGLRRIDLEAISTVLEAVATERG